VVEGVLTHVLLAPRFPALAWVLTVLSALGALWFTAFGRALATRPVTVGARRVYLRSGLRWTLSVPRADVLEARPYDASLHALTVGNPPNVTLVFRTPVRLLGVYGAQRSVQGVTLHLDDAGMRLATCIHTSRRVASELLPVRARTSSKETTMLMWLLLGLILLVLGAGFVIDVRTRASGRTPRTLPNVPQLFDLSHLPIRGLKRERNHDPSRAALRDQRRAP